MSDRWLIHVSNMSENMQTCMHKCMHACMHLCMYPCVHPCIHVSDMIWPCFRHDLVMFQTWFSHVSDMSWASFRHVLGIIQICLGHYPGMFWHHPDMFCASSRHVWDAFCNTLRLVFQKFAKHFFKIIIFSKIWKIMENRPKGTNSTPRAASRINGWISGWVHERATTWMHDRMYELMY